MRIRDSPFDCRRGGGGGGAIELLQKMSPASTLNTFQNIVSVIFHCASHALSENSARYDVILYFTMF